jgi:tRNA(Ile)-lysidine synthase
MGQVKKVAKFMLDARIPRDWRPRVPILCSSQEIVWVAGYRLDERFKVTVQTRQILRIQMRLANYQ